MIQKWYNGLLWISLLTAVMGTLIGIPFLGLLDLDAILYTEIVIIIPISGIIALLLIFGGSFTRYNYFGHWANQYGKLIDRSE
ncbi:hypothetical protein LCGC14_2648590 [marine sediment metagenome]|uniref:Uncharacterized protein n=1 Tax=marine sediment metagenome TaxID=412755 RepID=A0A0F8ZVJ4_9ZZZZ